MSSAHEIIEQLTGIKPADTESILQQVKANSARLNSCQAHAFEPMPGQEKKVMGKRYVCSACGGEVDAHAHYWHEIGRKSAAKG
jgi:predicted SprT family Zn-dependent metalloprotease